VAGNTRGDVQVPTSDLEALRRSLAGKLLLANDIDYESARKLWNGAFDLRPALIARCLRAEDVVSCVEFARGHDLLVAVRGGGHSFAGHSSCPGGFVIDLSQMRRVQVKGAAQSVRVEPGALLSDVDRASLDAGFVTSTGTVSDTGVAGFALGGGFGRMSRRIGLACDNLIAADIVTADGRRLTASARENSDLFWALRGGGGNFGIVTAFEFRLHAAPMSPLGGGLVFPFKKAREWLRAYADFTAGASDDFCGLVDIVPTPEGERLIALDVCHSGAPAAAEQALASLRKIGPVLQDSVKPTPYLELQSRLDRDHPAGRGYYLKSGFVREVTAHFIETLVDYLEATPGPRRVASLLQLGGATSRVKPTATAYWHREAAHQVLIAGAWEKLADADAARDWARTGWKQIEPHTDGFYVNLLAPDENEHRIRDTYGGNFERLVDIKRRYDPTNLFRRNANIPSSLTSHA
jgi:FAD/FMN-containing dehydrogenase